MLSIFHPHHTGKFFFGACLVWHWVLICVWSPAGKEISELLTLKEQEQLEPVPTLESSGHGELS